MSAGQIFAVPLSAVTVAASSITDLFQITAGSSNPIDIIGCRISQTSDVGDAAAEMLRVQIVRRSTVSTGTALTEVKHLETSGSPTASVLGNTTAEGTIGDILADDSFNIQAGFFYNPIPEERIRVAAGGRLSFFLPVGPADELTMNATLIWMEL